MSVRQQGAGAAKKKKKELTPKSTATTPLPPLEQAQKEGKRNEDKKKGRKGC